MALSVKKGIEAVGLEFYLYQVPEILSDEILQNMGAPPKADEPVITDPSILVVYDGIFFSTSVHC